MSDLVAVVYPTEAKAEEMRTKLLALQKDYLIELADAIDTYAICAPVLHRPAPPTGPVYVDQVIF